MTQLWELCWWECIYSWGWSDQNILVDVLFGVKLLVGLVCKNIYGCIYCCSLTTGGPGAIK